MDTVKCREELAQRCKYWFGDSYDMYLGWLMQAVRPEHANYTPVSEEVYLALDPINDE